jgi:glycosyltransferase involved in cell wall biosynthesis
MKLWVDGQALQSPSRFRGIGRYVIELLRAISCRPDAPDMHISFNLAMSESLDQARDRVLDFIPRENIHTWHSISLNGEAVDGYLDKHRLSEAVLAYHVARIAPDVALSASPLEGGNDRCVPLLSKHGQDIRTAGIFYDAIPLRFPDIYLGDGPPLDYFMRRIEAYREFDAILSISDFSHAEIKSMMGVNTSVPIYAGLSQGFVTSIEALKNTVESSVNPEIALLDPYVLYVGGLDWRKNVERVFEAFPKLPSRHENVNFVIAGQYQPPELERFQKLWKSEGLLLDRLHMLGQVTDEQLIRLYRNAKCLVQPSLLEGFGLTVLEAAACNTPVIVSNAGSLPEVVGTRDGLFDPRDAEALADRLIKVLEDPKVARKLVDRARARIPTYTWENSARLTMDRLKMIAQPPSGGKESARKALKTAFSGIDVDAKTAAGAAAFAEPHQPQPSRTLWDVSATSQAFAGFDTGIQRVVRNVAHRVAHRDGHDLFAALEPDAYMYVGSQDGAFRSRQTNTMQVGTDDTVVILDSSWDLSHVHEEQLRRAHLLGGKIYAVLYDLVPIRVPGMCLTGLPPVFSEWLEMLARYADGIICISRSVAEELAIFLDGIEFNRTIELHYWHLGADFSPSPPMRDPAETDSMKQFLMVGTIEPRKGHAIALEALEIARAKGLDAHLTVVGRKGWNSHHVARRLELKSRINEGVTWLNNASDTELAEAYSRADVIICASHAEGFGLPIVEAARVGIPVIASDIPVFKEVGEMATVTFFRSGDPDDLADAMIAFDRKEVSPVPARAGVGWDESADWLADIVAGNREPFAVHHASKTDYDKSLSRHDLRMDAAMKVSGDDFEMALIGVPAPSDEGVHNAYVSLRKLSPGYWTSLGPTGEILGGIALGARYISDDGLAEMPNTVRTTIPYAIVPGLDYIFAVALNSHLWNKDHTFRIQLVQDGRRWFEGGISISRAMPR